ncbi:Outer membrane protein (porin) [Arsukibacterium tuosuense]|uniref:Outer membrane protein (Porin) n=1 Tax=Arsukibacterium tuosuense TaxID=1323745 RepID=A0A285IX02_9GAMM|nr:porin [Arsukibacterium tuosuense]SNY52524.1 Outer membrane protein (porin) [Arsukibacterium tuosuense]
MKKSAVALAMALAGATTVQADPVTVYGQLNVSAQSSDEGEGRFSELKSNSSRFGLKGDFELDHGLTLVYQVEWGVDLADVGNGDNITSRNQYIGLKGNFGEVRLGRHDTALKDAQGKIDLFSDYEADVKNLWRGEVRASDSVTYYTPTYNGFGVHLTYVMEDAADAEDAFSAAVYYGDDSLKDGNFFAAIAMDSDVAGYDAMRAHVRTKLSGVKLGAMYHTQENILSGLEQDGWLVSAAYPFGKTELKAQYQTLEDDDAVSIGADYKAGKNTTLYAWYSSFNFDLAAPDRDYLAVGIKHKF